MSLKASPCAFFDCTDLDKPVEPPKEYGPELLLTGQFDTQADFDSWTIAGTIQKYIWNAEGSISKTEGDGTQTAVFTYPVTLKIGASYEFTADIDAGYTLNPRYYANSLASNQPENDKLLGETFVFVATADSQSVGIGYGNSLFTLQNISLKERLDIPVV